jgi:glycosyltransferase involved in cell wall biosynthesis
MNTSGPQSEPCENALPAKIVLVGNYPPDKQESMLKLGNLMRDVLEESGFKTETVHPIDRVGRLRRVFPCCDKWLGYIDKYLVFPFDLLGHLARTRAEKVCVYHITDHSNAVYSLLLRHRPRVVTCNDVLAIRSALGEIPENPTGFTGRLLQRAILTGLRHSPRIVCISENSARELSLLLGNGGQKITSALLPLNYDFHPVPEAEARQAIGVLGAEVARAVEQGCILHVGGNQWYKNRTGVVRIYSELARRKRAAGEAVPPLVLAGKEPDEALARLIGEDKTLPVHLVDRPGDEQVRALYSLARVLLFPSLQEGFGWPIVEAMACGCPVATTRRAPMTEAGGEAAIYIDPADVESAALAVDELLGWSEAERAARVERGFAHVARFSRQSLAAHYASAYRDVLPAGKNS